MNSADRTHWVIGVVGLIGLLIVGLSVLLEIPPVPGDVIGSGRHGHIRDIQGDE